MPVRCSVPGCRSNYRNSKTYVSVYSFPRNVELRNKWVEAIHRENWTPTKFSAVCRLHFNEEDVVSTVSWVDSKANIKITAPLTQTRLKETAVPSQFDEAHYYAVDSVKNQVRKRIHSQKPRKENDSTAKSKKSQKDEDGVEKKKKKRNYKRKNAVKIIKELQDESIDIVSVALDGAEMEPSVAKADDDNSESVSTVAEPFSIVHMDVQSNVKKRESDDESIELINSQSTFLVPNDLKISDILKYVNSLKNTTGDSGESDNKIVLVIEEPNNSVLYNIQSLVDGENNRKEQTDIVTAENAEDEEEQSVVVIVEDQVVLNMDEVPSMTPESMVQETVIEDDEEDYNELVLVEDPEEQEVTEEQFIKNDEESQEVTIDKEISKILSTTDLIEQPKIQQSNIINFAAFAADITNESLLADENEEEVDDVIPMESATGVITDNTQNLILDEMNNAEQIADNQEDIKENVEEISESISDVASDRLKNSNDKENKIPNDAIDKGNDDKCVNNNADKTVRFNVDEVDDDSKDDISNKDCNNFDNLSLKIKSDSIPAITAKIVNVLQTVMGGKNANNTHIERSPNKNSKDLNISINDSSSAANQGQRVNNSTLLNEYNNVPLFIMKDVIEEISKICSDHEMKRLSNSTKKSGKKSKTKDKIVFNVTFLNKNGNVSETAVSPENNCLIMSSNSLSNSSLKCTYSFQSPNTKFHNEISEKQKKTIVRKKNKNENIKSPSGIADVKDLLKEPIVKLVPIDNKILKMYENNEKISASLYERNQVESPTSLNSKRSKRIRRKSTFFSDEFIYFDEENAKKRRKPISNYYHNDYNNIKGISRIPKKNMIVGTISNDRRIINSIIDRRMDYLHNNLTNEESRKNETLNYLKLTVNNSSQKVNDESNNVNDIEEVLRQLHDPVNESENDANSVDDLETVMSRLHEAVNKEEMVTGINKENEQINELTTDNEITLKNIEDQLKDLHGENNINNNVENVTNGDDKETNSVNKNSIDKDDKIVPETSVALLYKENVITIKYIDDLQNFTLSNTEEVVSTEPDIKDDDNELIDENNDVYNKDVDNTEVDNKEEKIKTIYVNDLETGDILSVNDKKYKIKEIEVNASDDYTHKIVLVNDDTVNTEQDTSEISQAEEVIYLKVNCDDVTSVLMKGGNKLKPPLKRYKCQYCNNSYTRDSLRRHLKRHKGEKICPLCSRSFPNEDVFNIHFEDHKTNKCHERYICFTCGKKFVYLKNFKRHAIVAHKNMNPDDVHKNAVVLIPENENYKRRLKKDASVEGDDDNNRQDRVMCEICGQLTTAAYYKTHLVYHSGERPYRCDICSKGFCEKAALKTHMRRHTGEKPFVCEVCSKAFFCSSSLLKHKRIHDGSWLVQCPLCDKTLSSPYRLKFHLRIHSGEKPFTCEKCGRNFTCKKSYDRHLVIHNLEVDPCEEIINAAWSAATEMS